MDKITIGILASDINDNLRDRSKVLTQFGFSVLILGGIEDYLTEGKLRIHPYLWENDFSKARNKLHSLITTDWVLHLDSDETLDPGAMDVLQTLVREGPAIVKVSLLWGESRVFLPRLVPREATWKRPCNEIPLGNFPLRAEPRVIIRHDEIDPPIRLGKIQGYLGLLEGEYKRTKDPDLLFLSAIQASFVDASKARLHANTYLLDFAGSASEKQGFQLLLMEYLLAYLDYRSNEVPRAIGRLQKLIMKDQRYAEFWCLLGDCYHRLGAVPQAKEVYENALAIGRYTSFLQYNREWLEMEKYGDYPRARIETCNKQLDLGRVS